MAQREKRSVSFDPNIARKIEALVVLSGDSFSGWINKTAARELKRTEAIAGIEDWESEHGALTTDERESGQRRARQLLGTDIE